MVIRWKICVSSASASTATSFSNPIIQENVKQGSLLWWQPQHQSNPPIEGFTTSISYLPGESVDFKMKCSNLSQPSFHLEIYRLGYYRGMGARLVANLSLSRATCQSQPACMWIPGIKMTDCDNWSLSTQWVVPKTAVSGIYLALPTIRDDSLLYGGYIPFIVKQSLDKLGSDILFKTSDPTWVAYNKYGGWNIYGFNHSKDFATRAFAASYNRPFANRLIYPIGQQQNFVLGSEFPMLYWLEKFGYHVSYCAAKDVEDSKFIENYRMLLSVGHDEYWTKEMKDGFIYGRDRGVHLAFFSGNEMFWRVIWQENYQALMKQHHINSTWSTELPVRSYRNFICRKESIDNVSAPHEDLWTGTFTDPRHQSVPDPSNALSGQVFLVNSYRNDSLIVPLEMAKLRFWRNASFVKEEKAYRSPAGVLGYEWDVFVDDIFRPPGLFPVSSSPMMVKESLSEKFGASYRGSGAVVHKATLYRHQQINRQPSAMKANLSTDALCKEEALAKDFSVDRKESSSLVFGAGTIQWAWALSSFRDGDPMPVDLNLQQATMNLFADMGVLPHKTLQNARGVIPLWNDSFDRSVSPKDHLVFPAGSTDKTPPISHILHARPSLLKSSDKRRKGANSPSKQVLSIHGTARDFGGGQVAAVEVSVDAGKTWHLALGGARWRYYHHFEEDDAVVASKKEGFYDWGKYGNGLLVNSTENVLREYFFSEGKLYSERLKAREGKVIIIMSRAVDDSGNLERLPIQQALCAFGNFLDNRVNQSYPATHILRPSQSMKNVIYFL